MKDTMIGVDLAKNVFQIHAASRVGEVLFRKKVRRPQFLEFMASQPRALVVMEACGSAHHWARELTNLGHEVKLIAPQYVRPFVKRQKNDAADAEAIVIAARQPEMRFVVPKTEAQQARAVLFRSRDRLVHQRTELVNALRATLYEFGLVVPKGLGHLSSIEEFLEDNSVSLPEVVREECRDLLTQIDEQSVRITEKTRAMVELSNESGVAQRLESLPGVGPLTALAIEAFAPSMKNFRCGRDFAAWLGLVPRQFSSGGKERLGRISKAGQADIRRLLIIGAMTRVNWASRKPPVPGTWLARMLERKPRMLVAIALANKMARTVWAMLTKQENYRDPVLSAAA
ncbi:IS110 family transposase [Gluconacetobacter sp. 1b LMG 1731]|uniref:IS110 family transposase n=1 Tax=Gluconacetobacter dulcium TaxID=2729096 RepID=A0A7W4IKI4_9PROT|nr:IS110 family transposase [Gluconacetobacter dulcium]MBB2164583.1 IS110 family transposase [Gluconacetobacter dulcium]MBB2193650.1 IS110 family transposase [Gluconacetobacter dulcium]